MTPLVVDAHQDLAYNILSFDRDYTRSVAETRRLELGQPVAEQTEETLLGWPEYQAGQVAVIFGTLFAAPRRPRSSTWETQVYASPQQANYVYRSQVDAYYRLADRCPDQFRLLFKRKDLAEVLAHWGKPLPPVEDPEDRRPIGHPVGIMIAMEGAEGILSTNELEEWWERGLRSIGLAWAGNRYTGGTNEPGPLTRAGRDLLDAMGEIGFLLDISHMDGTAALQAIEQYPGSIIASHSNAAALLKGADTNRHLSDDVIRLLLERGGRIGINFANFFLKVGWRKADGKREVGLDTVIAQIDYVCQMAGDARHVGLGSDFDGGLGYPSVPAEIDTIADLQKIGPLLAARGYSTSDVAAIMGQNWLDVIEKILPGG